MKNPVMIFPDAMAAIQQLSKVAHGANVPAKTVGLVHLRASQINGCAVCIDLHVRSKLFVEDSIERLLAVAAWRDAPFFSEAERAALALAEAVTRLGDHGVADDVWADAQKHYDETQLAGLLLSISAVNVWNRLNVATRQVAGGSR